MLYETIKYYSNRLLVLLINLLSQSRTLVCSESTTSPLSSTCHNLQVALVCSESTTSLLSSTCHNLALVCSESTTSPLSSTCHNLAFLRLARLKLNLFRLLRKSEVSRPFKAMKVTLSSDHRTVDGAVGARWLTAFKDLENPHLHAWLHNDCWIIINTVTRNELCNTSLAVNVKNVCYFSPYY